jgi:hypothetical protein
MNMAAQRGFTVEHQAGIDLRVYGPEFRHEYSIEAPGIGDEVDGVFYEMLTSPAGLRSVGINQLSKSADEEIYEGSADFKIWQHAAGLYKIVRHFGRQLGLSKEQILQYALVACLGDLVGKGVKAHVSDMLNEGMGGTEDFHDRRVNDALDLGGINKILEKYTIRTPFGADGRILIDVPPWIEDPPRKDGDGDRPRGLNVDRLHYVNAEISLMFPNNEAVREAIKLDNLMITDCGELAFKDVEHARVWAKAANLCSSEHWNEPTNRLIELLSLEGMKRTISQRYLMGVETFDNGYVGAPEDYTFLIDKDFDDALEREATNQRPDIFMSAVYSLIQSIAHRERQRFRRHKREVYEEYINDSDAREYPNALINPHRATFGIPPAQVEILKSNDVGTLPGRHDASLQMTDGKTVGVLKRLKVRQFDPLVVTPKGAQHLSEIDPNFKSALNEHGRALNYVGAVALHANPESQEALIEGVSENAEYMERAKKNGYHLSPDQVRGIIRNSADRALELAIAEGRWVEL